jgi:hypothetical protein
MSTKNINRLIHFPALMVKIQLDREGFPYKICDVLTGINSVLVYVEEDAECPAHILEHAKGVQHTGKKPLQDRIYQTIL